MNVDEVLEKLADRLKLYIPHLQTAPKY